jgi:predicted amidophosphoribosyltransferase
MRPGTLWVPERIASALVNMGMGRVVACLVRTTALRKAARTDPSERPKPKEHTDTISVQSHISEQPNEILLVDDIVTRGATLLGAANRLVEVSPAAQIRDFAAMRTISDPSDFTATYEPRSGTIQYRGRTGNTLRRP